jgi:NAD(P)-dependent dehydrogenase (short-subunit alcohol dehydrogenase family)
MAKLEGKVTVITGGSSGQGLATAKRFVEEGAFVYIFARRQDELDKAVASIGRSVAAVKGDVSNLADLDRLYAKIASEKGRIDILFAAARRYSTASRDDGRKLRQAIFYQHAGLGLHGEEGSAASE